MDIPRDTYLADSLAFTPRELSWQRELLDWLPRDLIDAHTHSNAKEHVRWIDDRSRGHMLSTFPYFTLEESRHLQTIFFPGKRVRMLRFAKTFRGVDHRAANRYLLDGASEDDRVALYGLPDDPSYTIAELTGGQYAALKMYYSYLAPPATDIYQYFRPEILRVAQDHNIPIILHLPRVVTRCADDLRELLRDFPDLRVVLAHMGLTKMVVPGLDESYAEFARHDNVYLDTAMVPGADVLALGLRHFGHGRILFGSDEPLSLVRAIAYEHPVRGQRLVTPYPYHWVDPAEHAEFKHLAEGVTHSIWPCLQAIRDAVETLPAGERERAAANIFRDNAVRVYGFDDA